VILWAKVVFAAGEVVIGLCLLVVRFAHVDLVAGVRSLASRELRGDPGDFVARHALVLAPRLGPGTAIRLGILLAVYGAFKAAIVVGVLRHYRRAVAVGAVVFGVIATGGFVVLVVHPSVVRILLGTLDIAVAVAIVLEARELFRAG
jgi:uncharacterized membrane protein